MENCLFFSVDWGTSNFRIRLAEEVSGHIMDSYACAKGIAELHFLWQEQGGDRENIFLEFLRNKADLLTTKPLPQAPVVISGMASSDIGIRPLPYSQLPLRVDGSGLYIELIQHVLFPGGIYLVSGISSGSDIIRGEEIQVLGLWKKRYETGKVVFILPGTHCKHITCQNGKITAFNTYMTGEFFQVLSECSILRNSIEKPPSGYFGMNAFTEGVKISREGFSLLNSSFNVRTAQLFSRRSKKDNYYFLSGLLIGDELNRLKVADFEHIILCAGNNLRELYKAAINFLTMEKVTTIVETEEVECAVVKGHQKILQLIPGRIR